MKTTLEIQNLKCGGCESTIRKKLNKLPFINDLDINLEDSTVSFKAIPLKDTERVIERLSELGYPAVDATNSLRKRAQSYLSCAIGRIQK